VHPHSSCACHFYHASLICGIAVCVYRCRHGHTFKEHSAGDDCHRQMSVSAVGNIQFAKEPLHPNSWHCICALAWCTVPSLPLPVAVCSSCQPLNWSSLIALHTLGYCMIWLPCMISCLPKVHRLGHWSPTAAIPHSLAEGEQRTGSRVV
jgi:hypothetical protein